MWPEQPSDKARHSLRQALSTLRDLLDDRAANPPLLTIDRDTVCFQRGRDITVDVDAFASALNDCAVHPHEQREHCSVCCGRLERATALYRGEFLAGFTATEHGDFDDWVSHWRDRLQQQALDAFATLTDCCELRGSDDQARDAARRQLAIDPWRESAHRQLMRLHMRGGKRTAALAHYRYVHQLLYDELGVEPEEETTTLFERIRDATGGEGIVLEQLVRPAARAHNVPELVTPLLGREQEMRTAADALTTGCRLLTLVGPGGIGKTHLAMQLAREHASVFAHGAYYVPLAQVPSTEFVVPAIGEVLNIGQPGQVDPKRHLLNELTNQEILLVLDNFEHLLDGATLITEILNHAPAVNILVTSRERLNLRDEWALEIEGLGTPRGDGNGLEDYPAVELFVQRLRQVRLNDPVDAGEYPIIARICRLVEGMPLAIELAAAWAPTLPLDQIAREVERSVDFLATSMRDLPERHRSMAAVFNHSWHLLTTAEQQVFRRLSIIRGGFALAAAEQVAGATADVVAALVSKSFVRRQATGRYDIHELLRQFGERKLDEDPAEALGTGERHCEYFLEFIVQRGAMLIGRDQHRVLAEISMEIASVRAAARWATVHGKARELYRATQGLWLFYAARGWMREGERSFADVVTAFSAGEQPGSSSQRDHTLALGMAYVGQGVCLNRLGSSEDGRDRLQTGIALLRPLDAKRELGLALNLLASAIRPTGDTGQERALLEESISLFQEMEDSWGCGYSLNDLGMVAHLQGDDKEAVDLCRESLMIFDKLGDLRGRAFAQGNLGVIATELGHLEDAAAKHEESLALRQSMGDEWGSADTLVHLAEVARLMNRNRHARGLLMESLRIAADGEYQPVILDALIELATLSIPRGQSALAQEALTAVLAHPAVNHYTHTKAAHVLASMGGPEPRHDALSVTSNAWEAARMVQQLSRRYLAEGAMTGG